MGDLGHLRPLTGDERKAALERANKLRTERANLKKQLKAGEADPIEVMGLDVMKRVKAVDFIKSLPGIWKGKAPEIAESLGISANRRLGGLGPHQYQALKAWLEKNTRG